ncbi:MAG: phosphoheptose isomerase [archaeon]|nr:phosphoheptose isomerase [archaeon]
MVKKSNLRKGRNKAFMIDIDGVICEHIENEFPGKMKDAKEIPGAKEWINSKYSNGDYICLFTARLEKHRKITETWLKEHGFRYHEIIFGKPRGLEYHYIDDRHVQATTFKGRFGPMVKKTHGIEVFEE